MDAWHLTEALGGKWRAERMHGTACCPAHADSKPSMSISERDGRLLVHCFAGCPQEAVLEALKARGLWPDGVTVELPLNGTTGSASEPEDVDPFESVSSGPHKRILATYDYTDSRGELLYQVVRFDPKDFRQRRPDGNGGWIYNLDGVTLAPFRLPELLAANPAYPVFVVEGEKDAERLRSIGQVATCNAMGAGKWRAEFSEHLRGRHVVILPDNDDAGRRHADDIAKSVLMVAASVRQVALPDLPLKGDVSDWLDAGGSLPVLKELVAATPVMDRWAHSRYPLQTLADLVASVSETAPQLVEGILWQGRVTWAFSNPGVGKSMFLVALGLHVAAGKPFHGRPVVQGPVILFQEDSPLSVLGEYVQMLADIYEIDLKTIPFWVNRVQGLRVLDADGLAMIKEAIASCPEQPILALWDACERFVPSEKYTSREFDFLERALKWQLSIGITPVMIDHTRKEPPVQAKSGKAEAEPKTGQQLINELFGGRVKSAISDVMLHFAGSLKTKVRVTFAKFRGEERPPIDIAFSGENGFSVKDVPQPLTSETQRRIMEWFNHHTTDWASAEQVVEATGVNARSAQRALQSLVQRKWLERHGATRDVRYRLNTNIAGPFDQ